MTTLKLLALDEEDLQVISSQVQDAVVRVGDMAYLPSQKRFAAVVNRFDWVTAGTDGDRYRRRRTALRFDRVLRAQHKDLKPKEKDRVLSLLAIAFDENEAPGGNVVLFFSGGVTVQLEVECIEAELRDLGEVWQTRNKPEHPSGDELGAGEKGPKDAGTKGPKASGA